MKCKEKLLTTSQVSKLIGVCVNTLIKWDAANYLKAQRSKGGHRRYTLDQVRKYLEVNPVVKKDAKNEEPKNKQTNGWHNVFYENKRNWYFQEYLKDITDESDRNILANLLTNSELYYNSTKENYGALLTLEQGLWIIRESWLRSKFRKLVSVQPASAPAQIVYYDNEKTKCFCDTAVGTKCFSHSFHLFENGKFDDLKYIYADALASEIDYEISQFLPKIPLSTIKSDTRSNINEEFLSSLDELYDYIIAPKNIIEELKNHNLKVELFEYELILDKNTFQPIIFGGKKPNSYFKIPIFVPFDLFIQYPKLTGCMVRRVMTRFGWLLESDCK